jgi:hypothetical protein
MLKRPLSAAPRAIALIALAAALLAACGGPAAVAPSPTAAEAQPTTAPTAAEPTAAAAATPAGEPSATPAADAATDASDPKAGIQQTLDKLAEAYNENKPELIAQIVDPANSPLRRFWQTRLETFQQSLSAGQVTFAYEVQDTRPLDMGFVVAEVSSGGGLADWTFREVKGAWLISEPTKAQLGKREKIETEHFTFLAYPWAKDTTEEIIKLMENARERVRAKLGKVPDKKAEVYLNPTYGVASDASPNTLAYYDDFSGNARGVDKMVIFSPESYVFGFYDPSVGWQKELEDTLTHEYAHLVNNRMFTPLARMSVWMSEGLAEYVSDSFRVNQMSQAVQADYIIPILDPSGQVNKQDLDHLTILEKASDRSLAYGFAASLVQYIDEKYGGLDAFWKFVAAYDTSQSHEKALQEAFGVSYEQFDKDWRAWLKEKY